MKSVLFEKVLKLGSESVTAGVYVEEMNVSVKASYSLAKIVNPALEAINAGIDKLEELLPGDQKAWFETVKTELKSVIEKAISGKPVEEKAPEALPAASAAKSPTITVKTK